MDAEKEHTLPTLSASPVGVQTQRRETKLRGWAAYAHPSHRGEGTMIPSPRPGPVSLPSVLLQARNANKEVTGLQADFGATSETSLQDMK